MFTLTIGHPRRVATTSHPNRETALAALEEFLRTSRNRRRVATASWTHASYQILGDADDIVGHAAIDEICACTHPARDHPESGCTAISFDTGPFVQCPCPGHRPACTETDLFSAELTP